jgi:dTMP kinase
VKRGKFISVEGGEGAGKSTNIAVVREILDCSGLNVVVTREPGGTPLAEDIRAVLLARREERMCDSTELLLVCAARVQHVQMVIEPALARGDWVISDRFGDATLAYQGAGRGMDTRAILELHKLLLGEFAPDLTLLLDVPVAAGMQRMQARGDPDRFEIEDEAFFERIRACYLDLAHAQPERFRIIDAGRALVEVERSVRAVMQDFLDRHNV